MLLWLVLRTYYDQTANSNLEVEHCSLLSESQWDFVNEVPCFIILVCNTVFLVWIIVV